MVNTVRGFRRIGWVATLPIATIAVLAFVDKTKQFKEAPFEVQRAYTRSQLVKAIREDHPEFKNRSDSDLVSEIAAVDPEIAEGIIERSAGEKVLEIPGAGDAYFSNDVPQEIAAKVIAEFTEKRSQEQKSDTARTYNTWRFTVHRRVDDLRLAGLVVASLVISALVIQGLVSVCVWVVKGFYQQ